jgi:predicted MFS family arabinose efflux permease
MGVAASPAPSRFRWVVLGAYVLVGIVPQALWITFAGVLSLSAQTYHTSTDNIGLLSAVYPIVYVVLSLPAGYAIDAFGFRKAILVGGGFLAVSGMIRPFAPDFTVLLAIQTVGAVGQPFVLNSISKIVRGWFPASEANLATGLGTLSIFVGLLIGLGVTPAMAAAWGLQWALLALGAMSVVAVIVFLVAGRESGQRVTTTDRVRLNDLGAALRNRELVLLSALFFIGIGVFNAVATWIEPLLGARGVSSGLAGSLGGLFILGGIAGVIAVPMISDRYHLLKRPLLIILAASALLWSVLALLRGPWAEATGLLLLGFCFIATLPIGLELSARAVEPSQAGIANSVCWEFSQVGGFLILLAYPVIAGPWGWTSLFYVSSGLTALGFAIALLLRSR